MTALAGVPAVLTVEEAADLLRIGRSAAYAAVKAGDIPSIRVGRTLRVPRHRLEQLLGIPQYESSPTVAAAGSSEAEESSRDGSYTP